MLQDIEEGGLNYLQSAPTITRIYAGRSPSKIDGQSSLFWSELAYAIGIKGQRGQRILQIRQE